MIGKLLGAILLACSSLTAFAGENNACTHEDEIAAFDIADNLKSWKLVFQAFSKFSQCDDGGIAEGFDESIDKLLARKNPEYDQLSGYIAHAPKFKVFVLRHIASTGTADDIKAAGENALDCYVKTKKPICKDIALSVADGFDDAIVEISQDQSNGTATQEQADWKKYLQKKVIDIRKSVQD